LSFFYIFFNQSKLKLLEGVSKACHPALDAGSPEKRALSFRGLRVKPAMTSTPQGAFETAPAFFMEDYSIFPISNYFNDLSLFGK
jgi:hypothetical protein